MMLVGGICPAIKLAQGESDWWNVSCACLRILPEVHESPSAGGMFLEARR